MNISLNKNDRRARVVILLFSIIIFGAVSVSGRFKLNITLGFDEHIFAEFNAVVNTIVALLLVTGIFLARKRQYIIHRNIMLLAMGLSALFLLSYICQHLFAAEARYGDLNHDGILSADENQAAGNFRYFYYVILGSHIILAGIVLPMILFTAYRALIGENSAHRKLARITWPIWFYVAITGPLVYLMIRPYY